LYHLRPPSSTWSTQVRPPREVKMSATAVAALLVLATLAEAASLKYGHETRAIYKHDSYEPSSEHRSGDSYYEPSYESHYADQYKDHKPSYESNYEEKGYRHRPHHDSYDEDHYGRDAYSVETSYAHVSSSPSYKQTHVPHYRHKRAADKKDDDEDGKDKKDDDEDDDDEEEEEETEVSTETWINLAESLSLIAKKLDDGEDDDDDEEDDDDDDDEEESKMTESYTYKPMKKSKKYRKSHEPRSYRHKRAVSLEAGVTESQAMGEALDLVDGLREDQRKKNCPRKKHCKHCKRKHCKRCKHCKKCDKCKKHH